MSKIHKILSVTLTIFALTLLGATGAVAAEDPCATAETPALELAEAANLTPVETPAETPAEAGLDAEVPAPFLAQAGEKCGNRFCPPTQYCCNDSCGICADPGEGCIQIECN